MLESTEKGGVRNSIHNCLTVFQYDPILSGAVAKNLLTERIDLLKPIGRKRRTGSKAMTDTDMKYIRLYLEDTYGLTSEKKIADAADLAADANSYHPIRDYLNGLVWDGKERIRYCLRHFLGADTDNFTYHSLRLFLLGAIHRAFCPGCKFEVMLCLVGGQGAGKSTFFRLLAVKDEWFSDDLRKLDDDNVYSAVFAVGTAITFISLGIIATSAGRLIGNSSPIWYLVLGALMVLMALQTWGVFNLIPSANLLSKSKKRGFVGAFLAGILGGIFSSPCSTPVLIALLAIVAGNGNLLWGILLMLLYSIGHSALVMVAGTSVGFVQRISGNTRYNKAETVLKVIMGTAILLIGFYMFWLAF